MLEMVRARLTRAKMSRDDDSICDLLHQGVMRDICSWSRWGLGTYDRNRGLDRIMLVTYEYRVYDSDGLT